MKNRWLRAVVTRATAIVAVRAMAAVVTVAVFMATGAKDARAGELPAHGKIFVLMVWDGLRPDLVDEVNTPNLFALERAGVRFSRHHSIYPTLTMVDAAGLATGAGPGGSGIFGDMMYFAPLLDLSRAPAIPELGDLLNDPLNLESSHYLAALNEPRAFAGRLLGLRTTAQELEAAGGYVAVIGKQGPTLLFDDDFAKPETGAENPRNFIFVADDMAAPQTMAAEFAQAPAMKRGDYASVIARDAWFAKLATNRALPAAKAASERGKPAFVVFWQHNPDLTQHLAGLGTRPALNALRACDANLAWLRTAIAALGIADRTDLMVVSDHGFATIKAMVPLAQRLVEAGLKRSRTSKEIVVAPDGGSDSIYVSRSDFPTVEARRAVLHRIVEYAAAQEWIGPIFSRDPSGGEHHGRAHGSAGSIEGTFDESAFGLGNDMRAPDLIISFHELSEVDNRALTGALVRPISGVIYADADGFKSGMGMHGAAGARELHNFCAAIGPDFRHGLVDTAPTGNTDIAPMVAAILGQPPVAGITGRVLREALAGSRADGRVRMVPVTASTAVQLKNSRVVTTLMLTRYAGHEYLDDAKVTVTPSR
jgi:arylsulfatase A-like enzyme